MVSRCLIRGAKSRGPVSVTVPGVAISERFSVTAVRSSVVVPSSESWKVTARTAIPPEPSVKISISFHIIVCPPRRQGSVPAAS